MTLRQARRFLVALNLALGTAAVLLLTASLGLLATWQAQGADFLFKATGREPSARVGLVAIDDRSLRELAEDGRVLSWPRAHYARVVSALAGAGARVIVLDVLFDAPSPDDDELARAIAAAGNVVLPVAGELPRPATEGSPVAYELLTLPLPAFARAAAALGHANLHPDGDGTVRREQLAVASQGQEVPSLALAAAARYLRRPAALEAPPEAGALPFAGRGIPIADGHRGMLVNYLGAPYQEGRPSPFPVASFSDVLRARADLTPFRDRVVLVGLMATGFADDYWTPPAVGRKMAGVEIHANALETILRPAFLRPVGGQVTSAVVVLFALLAGLGAFRLRILAAAAAAFGLVATYYVAASALFDGGWLANMVFPPLAPVLAFGAVTLYRVVFVEADQRAARRLLSGYLSPAVMVEVLRDPERLRLGGEKRTMTVLFSDIRGFTRYAEETDPEALVPFVNEYLSEMSAVVFEHGGVVDKYMGDGLMAFWGAPGVQSDHARRACLAALGMLRRLEALHARWRQAGIPTLAVGIGVNTGPMSVGNMGSQARFSYTVVGDAVNLASRLEELNKVYRTGVIVSEATRQAAGEEFGYRLLDTVLVVGKRAPVAIYELWPAEGEVAPEARPARAELLRRHEAGLCLSAERRWAEAGAAFERVLADWPDDGPAAFWARRCAELAANPPPLDWDGVYFADT